MKALVKVVLYLYDGGVAVRREFAEEPTEHEWTAGPSDKPRTLDEWVSFALEDGWVTEQQAASADAVTLEVASWGGRDGVTFRWLAPEPEPEPEPS